MLDDRAARKIAVGLGLHVVGTVGLLARARQKEWIPELRPVLTALLVTDFRLDTRLANTLLAEVGEPAL